MHSTWTTYCPDAEPATIAEATRELLAGSHDLVLVLIAEGGEPALPAIVEALRATACHFLGGLFPKLIVAGRGEGQGALLIRLPGLGPPIAIPTLEASESALRTLAGQLDARGDTPGPASLIVLVDGLAPAISELLEATYDEFGDRVRYWGGGAGVSSFTRLPCLFSSAGDIQGGAVLALSSLRARLGVHHGWIPFKGPFVATRTRGNVVLELNWEPAVEVYAKHVGEHLGRGIGASELTEVTGSYPLGLQKQHQELVVRDPVGAGEDGSLLCVGDVPQNAALSLLHGNPATLIEAAETAAREAASDPSSSPCLCLIADCISRVIFLGEGFQDELDAIERGLGALTQSCSTVGVLTLGEISSRGDGYLEFFNKTCVVAALHEQ